jgi:chromosome partitioning protein
MKTIAIALQKGGTGKTSLAVSLAAELAKHADTVLIDADPQGNASAWIGPETIKAELAGVLFKKYPLQSAIVAAATERLSLLPSAGLGGELKVFSEMAAPREPFCMQDMLKDLSAAYRYAVIDLSPSFGSLEGAALIAADEVVTPIMPDPFGIDGLQIFASNLADLRVRMHTQKPAYKRTVISAIDGRIKQHGEIIETITDGAGTQRIYTIPVDQVFRRAQTVHKTIQDVGDAKRETLAALETLAEDLMN